MKLESPIVSVDILVLRGDKVLLGLFTQDWSINNKPTWGLPGREILFGEKFGDAVKRDVKEELGCTIKSYKIIAVNANYAFGNHYIGVGALAQITGSPKVTKPEDWQKWEWFDLNKLPSNLFPPAQNLIKSYRQNTITVSE